MMGLGQLMVGLRKSGEAVDVHLSRLAGHGTLTGSRSRFVPGQGSAATPSRPAGWFSAAHHGVGGGRWGFGYFEDWVGADSSRVRVETQNRASGSAPAPCAGSAVQEDVNALPHAGRSHQECGGRPSGRVVVPAPCRGNDTGRPRGRLASSRDVCRKIGTRAGLATSAIGGAIRGGPGRQPPAAPSRGALMRDRLAGPSGVDHTAHRRGAGPSAQMEVKLGARLEPTKL